MKDEYSIIKECPHCGHRVEFFNTSKKITKEEWGLTVQDVALLLGARYDEKNANKIHSHIGWKYYYPCSNCGYKIYWNSEVDEK